MSVMCDGLSCDSVAKISLQYNEIEGIYKY